MEPQVIYSKGDRVECLLSGDQGTVLMPGMNADDDHVFVALDRHTNMPDSASMIQKHNLRHLSAIDRLAELVDPP